MNQKLNCKMLNDDDVPANFLSSMIIEEAGCKEHIQIAGNGERAFNYLVNSEKFAHSNKACPWPGLIFPVINMPAMNCREFPDKYNELEKEHMGEIMMVMLTTSPDQGDEIKSKKIAGVTDFKHKPLSEQIETGILNTYFNDSLK